MRPALLLPLVFPVALFAAAPFASPWGRFWALIVGSFFVAKWLTWYRAVARGARSSMGRHVGYLWTWPGMNARHFLDRARRATAGGLGEWTYAVGKTAFGAVLIWVVCGRLETDDPVAVGWVGVTGLGFLLFFGLFHLLSLAWRAAGVDAPPQWRFPLFAHSITDFWSNRWNLAFRRIALEVVFRPAARHVGVGVAMLLVFLGSGLMHEVVISLPAGGGFGLPTLYFVLQAGLMALERSQVGKRALAAVGPVGGWAWAFVLILGPAYLLFHPPFLETVVLPGLASWGAL
ncbi:MAG: MBOAT family protein [Planctomycetota bacterium]|nr:MBOAT family protein [Planctomycetota bacterium]